MSTPSGLRRPALSVLALLASAGCAHFSQEDGEKLQNEVFALQTQVNAVQAAVTELQDASKKQGAELERLSKDVGQLNTAARRNDADFGVQLDTAMQSVAQMKGLVASADERLSTLETAVNKVQEELDLRFQGLADKQRVDALKSAEEKEKAVADAKRRERLLGDPKDLFAEVDRLIKAGSPAEARKLLRELTLRAKTDKTLEKSLSEAQFLIGETFYAEENWQQAAAEYNVMRKSYAKAAKVPDALFKLGMCFEKLKLPEDAKVFYTTIVQSHSKSSVAKSAKARLDALK